MRAVKVKVAAVALLAGVSVTACGASGGDAATGGGTAATSAAGASGGAAQSGKVSANTASESEIAAALKAAGVDNADRWAHEVIEYRPYAAGDANLTSLRDNLAKYNPGEETVNEIVSALTP
ncbi:hypothetical protein [Nonomuraea pusilla]|uniref:Lipoprotein n=1 Tax=Nonomuraea pusilla TaxID=46177 RepID=A0A1H8J088_9ACTN|nr:hypothetical protein [Nonomuraea pusilla]SEN73795.1 hypothetical protein SAMN05660976_08208 [Nonomuraea pusilla]